MNRIFAVALLLLVPLADITAQKPVVGGKVSPTGLEIDIDLPGSLHRANVSSRGEGCCTHTSVHHVAVWQNIPALQEFPKWVQSKGLPGGTYPKMMADRINLICKDRGQPVPAYLNLEGKTDLYPLLKEALKSGRMVCVTYCVSPTGRYSGQRISHMVNLVHFDDKYACILDNNYIGEDKYEWISVADFTRTFVGNGGGWAIVFLAPAPPNLPWN